jgi:glycosyltransferase involved in cell wall biosynthesis
MRIAFISGAFQPEFGGMAGHAYQVALYLSRQGHDIAIYARKEKCSLTQSVHIRVIPLLTHRFPGLDCLLLKYQLRLFKPDRIHISEAGLAYRSITRRYPTLVRVVGNDFLRPWTGFNLPLRFLLYRIPSKFIRNKINRIETLLRKKVILKRLKNAAILTNSQWTKNRLMENGIPEGHITMMAGGVDTGIFKPSQDKTAIRRELGLSDGWTIFITVCNLIERKGIDRVIQALARVIPECPDCFYVIVGDGNFQVELNRLIEENHLHDHVRFTGRLHQDQVARYYQASDIYVQISRDVILADGIHDNAESMGRTFIEAGACGLPVIAADVGGIPSVVGDGRNGILVKDPGDIGEISEKMLFLAEKPAVRRKLGENGTARVRNEFAWTIVCPKIERLMMQTSGTPG